MSDLFFDDRTKVIIFLVVILGGQHVDIMFVLSWFSEMRVFLQMRFLNDILRILKGEERT